MKQTRKPTESVEPQIVECIEQADICCERAREAARFHRLEAACGLFATAVALCQRTLATVALSTTSKARLKHYLDRVLAEMAAHTQLAHSLRRPLHKQLQSPQGSPSNIRSNTRFNAP